MHGGMDSICAIRRSAVTWAKHQTWSSRCAKRSDPRRKPRCGPDPRPRPVASRRQTPRRPGRPGPSPPPRSDPRTLPHRPGRLGGTRPSRCRRQPRRGALLFPAPGRARQPGALLVTGVRLDPPPGDPRLDMAALAGATDVPLPRPRPPADAGGRGPPHAASLERCRRAVPHRTRPAAGGHQPLGRPAAEPADVRGGLGQQTRQRGPRGRERPEPLGPRPALREAWRSCCGRSGRPSGRPPTRWAWCSSCCTCAQRPRRHQPQEIRPPAYRHLSNRDRDRAGVQGQRRGPPGPGPCSASSPPASRPAPPLPATTRAWASRPAPNFSITWAARCACKAAPPRAPPSSSPCPWPPRPQ